MSDESSRSARPSGQRRNDGAPTWWAALDRSDLPDGESTPAAHRRWYEDGHAAAPGVGLTGHGVAPERHRNWIVNLLVFMAIVVIVLVGFEIVSPNDALTVTMLLGVPLLLAAVTAVVVARRSR